MPPEEIIEIPLKDYKSLLNDRLLLVALQAAGVDNWDGYDNAMEIFEDMT